LCDAGRLNEAAAGVAHVFTQHIFATSQDTENMVQQITDLLVEADNRMRATGIVTKRDRFLFDTLDAMFKKLLPFPCRPPPEEIWEQSGHTDMVLLRAMLSRFEAALPPVLFSGLNEVLLQQQPPDHHLIRWFLVFEGHYFKHLTWEQACVYASKRLAGTSAGVGWHMMAKSYKLYRRRFRSKSKPG
jgi:hypothetical protein